MRTRHKIILASTGLGLLMWVIDGLLDYLFFYPGSLLGLLIFEVPEHEVYVRLLVLTSFVAFGLITAGVIQRREEAENRARRANRSLRMLSDCNQVLIRADDETQLLEDVCQVIVDEGGYRLAWVGLTPDDEPDDVRVVAKAGEDGDRLARLEVIQAGDDPGSSAALRAMRRGAPITVGEPPTGPGVSPRSAGGQDGDGAVMALPLKGRDGTLGALSVYADDHERFGPQETRLLTELASDLAFGIQTLRGRAERRRAQKDLRKSKTLLDRTGRMARVGGWELDAETLEVRWTEETYRIHEVPLDYEPPLEEAIDFWHPDDQDRLSRAIEKALEEGEPYDLELRFITAKGNHLWARTLCEPQVVDGETVELVGTFQDVTARKEAELALRASERRYRFLLRRIPVGVVVHGADRRILSANAQAEELLGLTRDQLLGRSALDPAWGLLRADGTPMPVEEYPANRVVDSRETLRDITVGIRRPDREEPLWMLVNADPVLDGERELERVLVTSMDITARKRAELALRRERDRAQQYLDVAGVMIVALDANGEVTLINRRGCEILGYDEGELVGRNWFETCVPESRRERIKHVFQSLMADEVEGGERQEDYVVTKDGEERLIAWHNTLLTDDDGAVVGTLSSGNDITARRRAQKALSERVKELRCLYAVHRAAQGDISPSEVCQQAVEHLIDAMQFPAFTVPAIELDGERYTTQRYTESLTHGLTAPIEVVGDRRGAVSVYYTDDKPFLLPEEQDMVDDVARTIALLVERQEAWDALEQYAEQLETLREMDQAILAAHSPGDIAAAALHRLRRLIPSLGAGVALYDFEGQEAEMLSVDAEDETILEQGKVLPLAGLEEAIEGSRRGEVFVARDLQRLNEPPPALRLLRAAGVRSCIGVPLLAHDYLRGVLGMASESPGAFSEEQIAIATDIAGQLAIAIEHARLYQELQHQSAELERRVAERTAELRDRMTEVEELNQTLAGTLAELGDTNRQLDEKADELQAANAELEAFAYSVSHDLRAPLRAINGFAEIIARRHRDSLDEEGRRYFDNVVEASQHMGELIDDLLRFSRLGRQAVRLRPVALDDVFARVSSDLAGRIAEEQAELTLPDGLPTVEGSPTLLAQIFTNLVDNALTYHPPDAPPRIEVGCEAQEDSVVVSVADEGIGIAPEFHDKIFRIFQRLHSQDEYAGTGIGLAMVRKAADLLGGQVWVESAEGVGSTFYVKLPTERES